MISSIAGDIIIRSWTADGPADIIIGVGDIILLFWFLVPTVLGAALVLWLHVRWKREARQEAEMIRAAQNIELGEGVTLLQGIRAFFGEDGYWGGCLSGQVVILAGFKYLSATMHVDVETRSIEVSSFKRVPHEAIVEAPEKCEYPEVAGWEERQVLLSEMVRAAKRPKT